VKILALDTATKTGWAFWESTEGIIESGVQDFTKRRGESNGLLFLRFRKWLKDLLAFDKVDLVAYERAHFRGAGTELLVGLQTRCQEIAALYEIPAAPVHTGTLKKWATGSGRASKFEMITRASEILGRQPIDDNEADAVLLACMAGEEYA